MANRTLELMLDKVAVKETGARRKKGQQVSIWLLQPWSGPGRLLPNG